MPTPSAGSESYPPGVTRTRVNEDRLYRAFIENTLHTSFVYHETSSTTWTVNGSLRSSQTKVTRYDNESFISRKSELNLPTDQVTYSNGSIIVKRTVPNRTDAFGGPQYARLIPREDNIKGYANLGTPGIGFTLNHSRLQYVQTGVMDGEPLTVLEGTETTRTDEVEDSVQGPLQNYSVRMGVRPDGRILNISVHTTVGEGESQWQLDLRYNFRYMSEMTVERPEWVDTAVRTAPIYEIELGDAGYYQFTNVRGRTLPAGTILRLNFPDGQFARVPLDEPLAMGETTYITRNRTTVFATRDEPTNPIPLPWDRAEVVVRTRDPLVVLGMDTAPDSYRRDEW